MWLHIIFNDKFVPCLIDMFEEALPKQHVYGMYAAPELINFPTHFVLINSKKRFLKILRSRSDWEGVIFNPLDPISWHWLPHIPKDIKVYWYDWGYEYYAYWKPLIKQYHYLPETKKWVVRNKPFIVQLKETCLSYIAAVNQHHLERVDFFVSPLEETYNLVVETGFLPSSVKYNFGRVGKLSTYLGNPKPLGRDLLLGNSAVPTNNHVEAINRLSTIDLGGRKIITPLSYGNADYREMVCRYGKAKLGDLFEPITEFLPLAEYQELLSRCGIVVMNHLRQQAFGNLIPMLMNGATIFMNETPLYRAFKKEGMHVFNFNNDLESEMNNRLSDGQIQHNREIMERWQGDDRVLYELKTMLKSTGK